MNWTRAAALVLLALAVLPAPAVAQEDEDAPVPPVYVPEDQQDGVPSGPPEVCKGQNCLPPEENPVEQCEGQNCTPEPAEESE
jgi:hypothetical protein